jgi:hypothetical protein
MNQTTDKLLVNQNLANFADPFWNVQAWNRDRLAVALQMLVLAGEVESDGFGGWRLTVKGRENHPIH